MNNCVLCDASDTVTKFIGPFAANVTGVLQGPLETLMAAVVGVWVVLAGYRLLLVVCGPIEILRELFFIVLAYSLLHANLSGFVNGALEASLAMIGGVSKATFVMVKANDRVAETAGVGFAGMKSMLLAAETAVGSLFHVAKRLWDSGGVTTPTPMVMAILLAITYTVMLVMYFAQVLVAIFRIYMIAAFSPFLALFIGFGWSRPMVFSALKTALAAGLVMFACSAAVAMALAAASGLEETASFATVNPISELKITSREFLLALGAGIAGTALMLEGVSIANSIAGAALSNTAAATFTGGAVGAAAFAAKKLNPINIGARYAGMRAGVGDNIDGMRAAGADARRVAEIVKKFKGEK